MFRDRYEAGKKLAAALQEFQKDQNAIVIALPRGGVVVGAQVANALSLPLDIVCPRKITTASNPEYALGAITETGEVIFSQEVIDHLQISPDLLEGMIKKEKKEAESRLNRFRKGAPPRNLKDKIVIIVDDGLATGSTMKAAIKTLLAEEVKRVIVAVPVAPIETAKELEAKHVHVISLANPSPFFAVGQFYEIFNQTTDEEVIELLEEAFEKQRLRT